MDWLEENIGHPYPTKAHLSSLVESTGLERKQVHLWCTNDRRVSPCPVMPRVLICLLAEHVRKNS